MRDDDILIGSLMEDSWLTLDQVAAAWGLAPLRDPSPLPPGKPTPALQAESGNP